MRILHTSDWHLGRSFHGVQLLEAQVTVLEALVEVVRTEGVDVVVIAGDIYDRAIPSADAVAALDHVLAELRATGAHVVGISGNHDSAVRLGFGERVFSQAGVTLRGNVAAAGQAVVLPGRDGEGEVAFYPIPYLEPESARFALDAPEARSHERLLQIALDRARADLATRKGMRSVAIVHAFVTGGQGCDSELQLAVGGSGEVALKSLSGFDYVALGHLHGCQQVGDGKARYSGTPMPYSFSERNHSKGVWITDLAADGSTSCKKLELPVHRQLFQLRGTLDDLLNGAEHAKAEGGYVQAILTDAILPMEAMSQVRRRFPNAVLLSHEPPERSSFDGSYSERVRGKNDVDLSLQFFEEVSGRAADDDEAAEIAAAIGAGQSSGEHEAA